MNMKCSNIHKKLIFFLENKLPEKEMEEVGIHLSECKDCAVFAEDLKKTLHILDTEKLPEVNPFFYTRVKAKMEATEPEKVTYVNLIFNRVLQPALFTVLLLAGIYGGIKIGTPSTLKNTVYALQNQEVPILNEMETESIEGFLMDRP
ncbi:MAG: zf-HC2 domain-containing protein [Draconibacterium sp.]